MNFTWNGFLLAPMLVPLLFSALLTDFANGRSPVLGMLFLFAFLSMFSYGVMACLFLPCMHLVSKYIPPTFRLSCIVGVAMGALVYVLFSWVGFRASGFNSGPPQGTFAEFLLRDLRDPVNWGLFPGGGLATAAAYWMLVSGTPRTQRQPPA
jgi:hypothetical protein